MKKSLFGVIFGLLALAVPVRAQVSDVYVTQNGGGLGGACGDGITASQINWSVIGAGSTIHLCGEFDLPAGGQLFSIKADGAAGNPLTIAFEHAVIKAPYISATGAINASGRSYLLIDGRRHGLIQGTQNGTGQTYAVPSRGVYLYACTGCTVKDIEISNLYVRTLNTDLSLSSASLVNCIYFVNSPGFTVDGLKCHDAGWALAGGGNNLTIENSEIYNVDHGLAMGASGVQTGFSIHDNHIHDFANWDSAVNWYHHDGIHIWANNGPLMSGGEIFRNRFDGDSGVNITGFIYLQGSIQNVRVYENDLVTLPTRTNNALQFAASQNTTQMAGGQATGNMAYNNYVVAGAHTSGAALTVAAQYNFSAWDNVLLGGVWNIGVNQGGSLQFLDNNLYEDLYADAGSYNSFGYQGHSYSTLAGWRAACGCDAHAKLLPGSEIIPTVIPF